MTNTELIDQYDLLPEGSHVLCALSGGRDSVYLLHRLLEWAPERGLSIGAAHFNHHLRGAESDRDEAFVRRLCEQLKVPLTVGGTDVRRYAQERGMGVEEAARECRYEFLQWTARDLIATAHNADDLAETMLFQLARGAGTKGLSGIPPRRGNVVRPILLTTRTEIDGYLDAHGIAYVEDSTNALTDCSRNVIRHEILPVMKQLNPRFVEHAAQSAMLLRRDEAYLQSLADAFLEDWPAEAGIPGAALLALDEAVASRVLRCVWGVGLTAEHVQDILKLCQQTGCRHLDVPGGRVSYDTGRLWRSEQAAVYEEIPLSGETGEVQFGQFRILWKNGVYTPEVHNSFNTFSLKYESITGAILLSSRRDGDRVKLQGSQHTKKLKQLFLERKLTQPQRAAVPVLRDDAGIAAVIGFGPAQRCAAEFGDYVIIIHWENKERNGGYYEHS